MLTTECLSYIGQSHIILNGWARGVNTTSNYHGNPFRQFEHLEWSNYHFTPHHLRETHQRMCNKISDYILLV